MERLNSDMINEIFRYLDQSYVIFSTFYVSKRIMEMSIRFLNFMNVVKLKKKSLFKALCRDIKDEVSIERFTNFGFDIELSNFNIYLGATKYDNLELLIYMLEITESVYDLNIQINDPRYNSLQYFYENLRMFTLKHANQLKHKLPMYSAKYGSFECLRYVHQYSCNRENYNNDTLQYVLLSNCYWNRTVCQNAAEAGSLECLRYLHENGCSWDK